VDALEDFSFSRIDRVAAVTPERALDQAVSMARPCRRTR
jgi:hypothetical protein